MTSRIRKIGLFALAALFWASTAAFALAGPTGSQALFGHGGVLLHSSGTTASGSGSDPYRMEPWNLWSRVDDGSSLQAEAPDLAFGAGDAIHCTHTATVGSYAFQRLMFATSLDQNQSWVVPSVEALQTGGDIWVWEPVFAKLAGPRVWIVYRVDRPGGAGSGIGFVKSTNGGLSFDAPVQVDDGAPYGEQDFTPNAVSIGDTVCVVWYEYGSRHLRFNRSIDAGDSWLADDLPVDDSVTSSHYSQPQLDYDTGSGLLYVAWSTGGDEIRIAHSSDFGDTWSPTTRVSDASASDVSAPSMRIGPDGTLYVLWEDFRNGSDVDVYFAKSSDHGSAWTDPPVKVNDETVWGNQYEPHLALGEDGVLHAAFIHNVPFELDVNLFYTRSLDGGLSWETPDSQVNDALDDVGASVPRTVSILAAPAGRAYVAWRDQRSWTRIYCASNLAPTSVADAAGPAASLSLRIYPNPAADWAEFALLGGSRAGTRFRIFDVEGRQVAEASAEGSWRWNLRDDEGAPVAAGLYLVRAEQAGAVAARRVIVRR